MVEPPRPRSEQKLRSKLELFLNGIAPDPGRYKLGEQHVQEIRRVFQAYLAAYMVTYTPGTKTRSAVSEKNRERKEAERVYSEYYNCIKNDPTITDIDKTDIGVRPINLKRTCRRMTRSKPKLKAICAKPGMHELRFETAAHGKSRPENVVFVQVYAALGEGKDQTLDEAREVKLFTKNPIQIEYKPQDNGKQACYWARYISHRGEQGPWSAVATMVVMA